MAVTNFKPTEAPSINDMGDAQKPCLAPVTLLHNKVSDDTIGALEFLLHEARRGEVIGLVFSAITKNRSCLNDLVGEAVDNPVFALGAVHVLAAVAAARALE